MFAYKIKDQEINYQDKFASLAGAASINCAFNSDASLYATCLSCLAPRLMTQGIGNYKVIFRNAYGNLDVDRLAQFDDSMVGVVSSVVGAINGQTENTYRAYMLRYGISKETRDAFVAAVRTKTSCFVIDYPVMEAFDKENIVSIVMHDPEHNSAVIFFSYPATMKTLHAMLGVMPILLPNIFTDMTDEEKAVFNALLRHHARDYIEAVNKQINVIDVRNVILDKLLGDFFVRQIQREIRKREEEYTSIRDRLGQWENHYADLMRSLNAANDRLIAAQNKQPQEDGQRLLDFFKNQKCLTLTDADEDSIAFSVCKYLDIFDEEVYRSHIRNVSSFLYLQHRAPDIWNTERKAFLDSIFGPNPVYRIRVYASYNLCLSTAQVRPDASYVPNDRIGNPHIHHFHCLGGYERTIREQLRNQDITGAVATCMASAGSLNIADSPVMKAFLAEMSETTNRFVERISDHKLFTPIEALRALKENDNGTEH